MTMTMTRTVRLQPQWHPRDYTVDAVTIECVERYKTSALSGDEWRFSYQTVLWRKGKRVAVDGGHHTIESAAAHLPWLLRVWGEGSEYQEDLTPQEREARIKGFLDIRECCQPGCSKTATVVRRMKRVWSKPCDMSEPAKHGECRSFCDRHRERGDCGLDDAESNYDEGSPIPPDAR